MEEKIAFRRVTPIETRHYYETYARLPEGTTARIRIGSPTAA
jgi:hypothetical protein